MSGRTYPGTRSTSSTRRCVTADVQRGGRKSLWPRAGPTTPRACPPPPPPPPPPTIASVQGLVLVPLSAQPGRLSWLLMLRWTRTHRPHTLPWPGPGLATLPDCLLRVHRYTLAGPYLGDDDGRAAAAAQPDCLLIGYRCTMVTMMGGGSTRLFDHSVPVYPTLVTMMGARHRRLMSCSLA